MKESCNWHPPPTQQINRARAHTKRFSVPYPEVMQGRSPPATPLANNKRQVTQLDKENYRAWDKPERKKTISPQRKKSGKRKTRRTQPNIIGYLNKTEQLRRVLPSQPSKVLTCGSNADFIRGKSAESKRQPRLELEERQYRDMSLSLKKRSLSKELKKIFKQDHRQRPRGKRASTQLNKHPLSIPPKAETIPLMRDILREIKRESDNARRKDKDKDKERDATLNETKKLRKERKKSLETTLIKKVPPQSATKTVNTAPSQPRLKKRRISTVVEELPQPESDSLRFRQSTEEAYLSSPLPNREIEVVKLTEEAVQFDLDEFREFESRFFLKDRKKRHPVHLTTELKIEMAVRIQRWWRRILTRRLIDQFIRYTRSHTLHSFDVPARTESVSQESERKEEGSVGGPRAASELSNIDLNFHEDGNQRKITYISNLSGEENVSQGSSGVRMQENEMHQHQFVQDDIMNRIKQKELEKLNEFITLIKESLNGGNRTEDLLKKLVERSQLNCKSLEKDPEVLPSMSIEAVESEPTDQLQLAPQPQENYEQVDDDYRSRGDRSQESGDLRESNKSGEDALNGEIENKRGHVLYTRPITPSLEHRSHKDIPLVLEQERLEQPERLVLKDEDDCIKQLPLSIAARERLMYDRNHSPSGRSSSDSSTHELMPYIQDDVEQDPLVGLQAAQRLRKKLEQLNSRTFEAENEAEMFLNDSDEEEEAPPLKREMKVQSKNQDADSHSESSEEWEAFPRLDRLIQLLPDKERLSDDAAHIILTHLITEFLKEVSQSPMVKLIKVHYLKMRQKEKKTITIKKAVFRKSKGIKTNIAAVKDYLKGFNMYLIEKRAELLKKLDQPAAPSARELLRYMHPYEQSSESCEDSSVLVLPVELFEEYWSVYDKTLEQVPPGASELQRSEQDYLHRITHIHCRAIFDGFNECLNFERSYGEFGKPFPWKSVPNFARVSSIEQYKAALENAYQRTIQIASSYCGIIFDKQESPSCLLPTKAHMEQMHEDRLSRTLVLEMYEAERNWLFYDDEETEVAVDIAHNVCEFIVREAVEQLQRLFRLRWLL